MADLLELAIEGHGGLRRWEQLTRFRVAGSITGAIWALKRQPGLLEGSADGFPVLDPVSVAIDFTDVAFA